MNGFSELLYIYSHRENEKRGVCLDKLIKRTKIGFLLAMCISIFITYIGIYLPLKGSLKKTAIENFSYISDLRYQSINYLIEGSVEGALSLSSRTMIKNKIIDYKKEIITLEELKEYTSLRYADGVKVLKNINFALRIVDKEIITSYGKADIGIVERLEKVSEKTELYYQIYTQDNETSLEVFSPIYIEQTFLGYDIVSYDINESIKSLDNKNIGILALNAEEANLRMNNNTNKEVLFQSEKEISYIRPITKSNHICISILKSDLFKKINQISFISMCGIIGGFFVIFILINDFIIKYAAKLLTEMTHNKDVYKNYANKDILTGAYSRFFLENWYENQLELENEVKSIVVIDVDKFKYINDNYGHLAGDEVLKRLVWILKSSVRDEDFVVRYGGDEFLIILKNANEVKSEEIIKRIKEKIDKINDFEFKVSISHGIQEVKNKKDFYTYLKTADERMYISKKATYK